MKANAKRIIVVAVVILSAIWSVSRWSDRTRGRLKIDEEKYRISKAQLHVNTLYEMVETYLILETAGIDTVRIAGGGNKEVASSSVHSLEDLEGKTFGLLGHMNAESDIGHLGFRINEVDGDRITLSIEGSFTFMESAEDGSRIGNVFDLVKNARSGTIKLGDRFTITGEVVTSDVIFVTKEQMTPFPATMTQR